MFWKNGCLAVYDKGRGQNKSVLVGYFASKTGRQEGIGQWRSCFFLHGITRMIHKIKNNTIGRGGRGRGEGIGGGRGGGRGGRGGGRERGSRGDYMYM